MIIILGRTIIFWTGVLAGLLFILSSLGCRCLTKNKLAYLTPNFAIKNHNLLMWLTIISVIIHMTLVLLATFGTYI